MKAIATISSVNVSGSDILVKVSCVAGPTACLPDEPIVIDPEDTNSNIYDAIKDEVASRLNACDPMTYSLVGSDIKLFGQIV